MSAPEDRTPGMPTLSPDSAALMRDWRRLGRAAGIVALLSAPAVFVLLYVVDEFPLISALLLTVVIVVAFRGLIDVLAHRLIPRANLYGAGSATLEQDASERRRLWFWRALFRRLLLIGGTLFFLLVVLNVIQNLAGKSNSLGDSLSSIGDLFGSMGPTLLALSLQLPLLFLANFLIFFGPFLLMAVQQMKGYEPGDADWGVRLSDVRGQQEPKQEVARVISLWQSGDDFRAAGGKPERGLLFLGSPGTGKTMLSKAIATSFNSPIVTMPGSGFAQMFMGMDVIVVLLMIRKARKLAKKWGGQCIIFIDEIDAVGLRRQALAGAGAPSMTPAAAGPGSFEDYAFYGPHGALTQTGDLILETRAWRERLFDQRAPGARQLYPNAMLRLGRWIEGAVVPGMMGQGGGGALNQLLVQMDGVDEPPFFRKFWTGRFNTWLDATYFLPRKVGKLRLRPRPPKPRPEQIYFIGATNVPLGMLDPALIRPGRMGRHIHFRTPTSRDRKDIFDLYLKKVDHDPGLDTDKRRDELARMTNGYSPAMIEQVCSLALTYAHSDNRKFFEWPDLVEAMTTVETGTAIGVTYVADESRAVAIHEAGHAVASHVYMEDTLSTRLSIRMRSGSLGHHQTMEKEERFSSWRHQEVGKLVWTLGAMAAEHVFYGENSTGVGGDVQSATDRAAWMVGMCGMGPEPITLDPAAFDGEDAVREEEERIMARFERIGLQIMNRASLGPMGGDAFGAVLGDPSKRRAAAQILGQAYITAVCLVRNNREQVAQIAEILIEKKELHGDEVVDLLEAAQLQAPTIDVTDPTIWPKL